MGSGGRIVLPSKKIGETVLIPFDFASKMNFTSAAETISTQVVTATVYSGTDASPSSIISGSATASGTRVTQAITAGTAGVIYILLCSITTSLNQALSLSALLAIEPTTEGVP